MSNIKAGDVCFLKTSGEIVFVLSVEIATQPGNRPFPALCGETATVRVPVVNKETGILHEIKTFAIEELETPQERLDREVEESRRLLEFQQKLASAKTSAATVQTTGAVSKPN